MTRNREIERVLDEWFAEGPTRMPDRLFDVVVDRIDRTPQRRLARLQTRLFAMNSNLRIAAAAAVIVVVGGAGLLILGRMPGVGVSPSPSPFTTVAPSSAASVSPLPVALRYKWVGAPRTVPEITPPITCSRILLGSLGTMEYNGCGPATILSSTVGMSSPNTIQFTSVRLEYGCHYGAVGSYTFALSSNGKALTLTKVADACAARAGAVSGDWNRADCPDTGSPCLGDLDAGAHVSANFSPFVPRTAWVANYGALSYTVPGGWANTEDCDDCYTISPQGAPDATGIYLRSGIAAHVQDAACTNDVAPGVGLTASAITTWLTKLPGLAVTAPSPVTIGGLSGFSLDASVAAGWTHTCSYSNGEPVVPTFTDPTKGGFDWNVGGQLRARIILLDLGDGRAVLIEIDAPTKAAYDALLPGAMQVIDSFQFSR